MGLWNTDAADAAAGAAPARRRRRARAHERDTRARLVDRHTHAGQVARSAVVSSLADAILVSGPMQGAEPSIEALRDAADAVAGAVPVLVNTGAKSTNVREFLEIADGVIVGSDLKVDGHTWNPVDPARVERFLAAARA